ncbi:MAG: hypothetical protein F6K37_34440 [Moorea sp. SIO4E2]|uniref:hypothetical protein n=1 Tax=Moorena sp. SIO4E2 TaxID=2607826 RepID=UPI0013BCA76C|nr:hypothetical protein [Moorena sp. SIO4E2]NEQ10836.1 hypothetical protein [Moorena sp. SIO4E2]
MPILLENENIRNGQDAHSTKMPIPPKAHNGQDAHSTNIAHGQDAHSTKSQ